MSATAPIADPRRLAIPIYLNQQIVFDLLAIVADGFSQLRTIRTAETDATAQRRTLGAEIGASNVFAFLGIRLGGDRAKEQMAERQTEMSEERVFTPVALFARLRDVLLERGLIRDVDHDPHGHLASGDFVEFSAVLRKNPLLDAMDGLIQLMGFANLGSEAAGAAKHRSTPRAAEPPVLAQMRQFRELITQGHTIDLLGDLRTSARRAVVTVELQYFSDESPAAIIDGEFRMLGKIIRAVEPNAGTIDLLRGSSIGRFGPEVIGSMIQALTQIRTLGVRIPDLETSVAGPAFHVLPIAIYA